MQKHTPKGIFPESFSLIHPAVQVDLWSQDLVTDGHTYGRTDGQGVFRKNRNASTINIFYNNNCLTNKQFLKPQYMFAYKNLNVVSAY